MVSAALPGYFTLMRVKGFGSPQLDGVHMLNQTHRIQYDNAYKSVAYCRKKIQYGSNLKECTLLLEAASQQRGLSSNFSAIVQAISGHTLISWIRNQQFRYRIP